MGFDLAASAKPGHRVDVNPEQEWLEGEVV
jgi:hypothetical protein